MPIGDARHNISRNGGRSITQSNKSFLPDGVQPGFLKKRPEGENKPTIGKRKQFGSE